MEQPLCPKCGANLEILTDEDDDDPRADRWTCIFCNVAYTHRQFPLPAGYVRRAREMEAAARCVETIEQARAALAAWNAWARKGRAQ